MTHQVIEDKVTAFVGDTKGFTSVDIANAIKTEGTWVRNREVASWLRNWTPPVGYSVTKISVSQGSNVAQASVYIPNTLAITDYVNTQQDAMTPGEFEAMHGKKPFGVATSAATDASDADDTADGTSLTAKLKAAFSFPTPS